MKAVAGVFVARNNAQRALAQLHLLQLPDDRITLLTPESSAQASTAPSVSTEQPGMGKAIGALVGTAAGMSGGRC